MKKTVYFIAGFIFACLNAELVYAQPVGELTDRLDRLESSIKNLQKKANTSYAPPRALGGSSGSGDNLDAMVMRLQDMEQLVQSMTGDMETIKYNQDKLSERLDKINADNTIRFNDLEEKLLKMQEEQKSIQDEKKRIAVEKEAIEKKQKAEAAAAAKAEAGKQTKMTAEFGKVPAKELYDGAFASMKKADYGKAEKQFEAFLTLYPKDELAGNAQYWLGESFYARGAYDKAAVAFADGFKNYRQSQKAPDNLLKLGLTMARLNKKTEACIAFKNFSKEYPKVSDAMKKRLQNEAKKVGCQ